MDISNKTLAMFLVAAIVVSIAGTTISLNRLGDMGGPTGYATTDVGNVTINVGAAVSIVINESGALMDTLAFTCSPNSTRGSVINSDGTLDTANVCTGYPANGIQVYNDGNVDANVSVNVSDVGENVAAHTTPGNFLPTTATTSWLAYRTADVNAGCAGSDQPTYVNFTAANTFHRACDNLSFPLGAFEFDIEMLLPQSAETQSDFVEIYFWAKERT